ncbi:MAG: glucosamine-6-phosphate deaminase [Verrucomicrobia bacterium]|nr:glucosamine-6-phosphate deaminase [Verrucomicrobiota bacterium]MDA1066143.1 glucosamine-6-phosphate deaminase [Verrucomicrobiota bacterium]
MSTEAEQFERISTRVFQNSSAAARMVASEIADLIKQRSKEGKQAVLGLATGSTPLPVYQELVRLHREENLSFRNVITFNLDEYYGLNTDHPESYHQFMWQRLFSQVDIPKNQVHLPSGTIERSKVYASCAAYDGEIDKVGGLDYQILGIGRTGHIGFNEPGSTRDSKTRLVSLDALTRRDAARDFLGEANVPRYAITMGVGTILKAKRIVLMAWGQAKAGVVQQAVEEAPNENLPAGLLQGHPDVRFFIDDPASELLTRFRIPWLVGPVDWDKRTIRKAVLWLSKKTQKPILKLQDSDYNEFGLGELLTEVGPAYDLNISVFNQTQHTITGWPGGKPKADDSNRPERASPFPKRVLVLAPEPDEDVLCMGGTIHRLKNQGSEVNLAYLTSGNLAVPDSMARQILSLMSEMETQLNLKKAEDFSLGQVASVLLTELQDSASNAGDSKSIRQVKSLVRRNEAGDASHNLKISKENLQFLDLPFYENGRYRAFHATGEDKDKLVALLREVEPHQIYFTGGHADPGSVSGISYYLLKQALKEVAKDPWIKDTYLWSYRGIGQEWPLFEIDMAVPLSPDELNLKVEASFQYRSQRRQFPLRDSAHKEIWQQTDELNRNTAADYDAVGMAEYEAIEAFKRINLNEILESE